MTRVRTYRGRIGGREIDTRPIHDLFARLEMARRDVRDARDIADGQPIDVQIRIRKVIYEAHDQIDRAAHAVHDLLRLIERER